MLEDTLQLMYTFKLHLICLGSTRQIARTNRDAGCEMHVRIARMMLSHRECIAACDISSPM